MDIRRTMDEQMKKFRELGIEGWDGIDLDEAAAQAEQMECEDIAVLSVIMLTQLGMGAFDEESGEMIPASDSVYAFDAEAIDVSCMYTDFIAQAARISGGEFRPNEVRQRGPLSGGSGEKERVSLLWRGHRYSYAAEIKDDWFDDGCIDFLNEVLTKEKCEKQFFGLFDGMQGIILFYNTQEWLEKLLAAMQGA